jgi:hypothetical protein
MNLMLMLMLLAGRCGQGISPTIPERKKALPTDEREKYPFNTPYPRG